MYLIAELHMLVTLMAIAYLTFSVNLTIKYVQGSWIFKIYSYFSKHFNVCGSKVWSHTYFLHITAVYVCTNIIICIDDLPKEWSPMPNDTMCQMVTLDTNSDEYSRVKKFFTATMPEPQQQSNACNILLFHWNHIIKIERIQSPALYTQYMTKKKRIGEHNSSGFKNERKLFYGCCQDVKDKISHWGFNITFAGNNGMPYTYSSYIT